MTAPPLAPVAAPGPRPRVSVVMPTYRRPAHVGASLRSLLDGRFEDLELLVRDDGPGDDGTAEAVAGAAADDPRVRYHRNPANLRMPGNLNAGIAETRGELIAVCHDHDRYRPDFLARMVEALDAAPTALFVHCGIALIDQAGKARGESIGPWPGLTPGREWQRVMLRTFQCPVCALTVVRRGAHERWGLYDPAHGFVSDVEMWLRLSGHGDVAYVAEPLIEVRDREDDHPAAAETTIHTRAIARAHRRYLPEAYGGLALAGRRVRLEARLAAALLRHRAWSLKRRLRGA